jgi:hypothetical protein
MSPAFRASGNYFAVAEKVLHETCWFISEIAKSSFTAEGAESAEARPTVPPGNDRHIGGAPSVSAVDPAFPLNA